MRILVSAPRKSGGAQLRCLIATAYGLAVFASRDAPDEADTAEVGDWLAALPERSIASVQYAWTPSLAEAAKQRDIALAGVIRHPLDLFVSNFDVAQQRAARGKNRSQDLSPGAQLAGLSLDDPAVLDYARSAFGSEVDWLRSWHDSNASVVRFELLETNPAVALSDLADSLGNLEETAVDQAVNLCPAENVIVSRPDRGRRMGNLSAGSWRERLPEALQAALCEQYSRQIELLGYEAE